MSPGCHFPMVSPAAWTRKETPTMPLGNLAKERTALRQGLENRRHRVQEDLRLRVTRIRDQGTSVAHTTETDDDASDLDVTLVEIANETLRVIDAAIARLDCGQYGYCARCHGRISESRLRAVPFAVRDRKSTRLNSSHLVI